MIVINFFPRGLQGIGDFPGPAGANAMNRNVVGKWCKQGLKMASSSGTSGDLIAVGADGRGGRIKILRTHSDFMVSKELFSFDYQSHKLRSLFMSCAG